MNKEQEKHLQRAATWCYRTIRLFGGSVVTATRISALFVEAIAKDWEENGVPARLGERLAKEVAKGPPPTQFHSGQSVWWFPRYPWSTGLGKGLKCTVMSVFSSSNPGGSYLIQLESGEEFRAYGEELRCAWADQ